MRLTKSRFELFENGCIELNLFILFLKKCFTYFFCNFETISDKILWEFQKVFFKECLLSPYTKWLIHNIAWRKFSSSFLNFVKRGDGGKKHEIIQIAVFPIFFSLIVTSCIANSTYFSGNFVLAFLSLNTSFVSGLMHFHI